MNGQAIIQAAIPGASADLCEHIIWGRTPFPCGPITAKSLYQAARRFKRAADHGIQLCDFCDNIAAKGEWCCEKCNAALGRAS